MTSIHPEQSKPHLVWIDNTELQKKLHATRSLKVSGEIRKLGWRVTLIYPGTAGAHKIGDVEVYGIPWMDVYLLRQLTFNSKVIQYLSKNLSSIDVVMYHDMAAPWLLAYQYWVHFVMGKTKPLFVMDTRTLPMEPTDKRTWKDRIRSPYLLLMNHIANHLADGRTAITQRMAYSLSIPEEKLWGVWTSGVEIDEFKAANDTRKFPSCEEPINIIYIGAMQYERNLMNLCRAVVKACDEGMEFHLTLVGEGNEWHELKMFSENENGKIDVLPPLPHNQVWIELAKAHVGVLAFPDEEKFRVSSPIKLFEYMAAGLPVLATPIVCHTDVIKNGKYVFWSDGSDVDGLLNGLKHIWQARGKLATMSVEAMGAAKKWTWSSSARNLEAAFETGMQRCGLRLAQQHFGIGDE